MIVITGATGQLGRLVIAALLRRGVAANHIVAAVRSPQNATDLAGQGVIVRRADYTEPARLDSAFAGAEKVLLISGNQVGQRVPQHQAVIDAAKRAGVALLAYTSLVHATQSPLALAAEHRATETAIAASGLPTVILRNGWYNENFETRITGAVATGAIHGCAGTGRFSSASRADYAEAAAAVLTRSTSSDIQILELAGSEGYSLADLAGKVATASGKPVQYHDLSQVEYEAALLKHGLPDAFAKILADSDAGVATGALFDEGKTLENLIGRPTTSIDETIAAILQR